jgi:hypothetical protein
LIRSLPLQTFAPAQRIELEYDWELLIDATARMQFGQVLSSLDWRDARVGLSWNAQFPELRNYMGAAWYRTHFELPVFRETQHVLLKFGAVDYFCEVFVNGRSVGTHEGGYTPFSFEITNLAHPGPNQVVVHVIDPPMDEEQNRELFPDMMYNEIPHGKQNWYIQNSGIWQGVRVELCPAIYIERLDITPADDGQFEIEARLAGVGLNASEGSIAAGTDLRIAIFDSGGTRVFECSEKVTAQTEAVVHIKGKVSNVRLWSPSSPALYVLEASLAGAVQYHRRTRFGFRKFEARDGKLFLNSHPFYMRAALDQDFYPETVHTPTSEQYVRDMMVKAKGLGFNVLRCHLKVAHPVYLDVADEVGMLIWAELPSWSDSWFPSDHFSTLAAVRTDKMFWEILIRDWNHPCIVIQTIMNESWGINLTDASQREWLRTTFDRIKRLLSPLGRLVVDNSACEGNFHIKSDLEDFHQYYSMPDHVEKWDKWLNEFAQRPAWTYSPYGDAERTGNEPLLVSEFGNWGLPKLPEELPWWFSVNFGEREVTRPSGVLERFNEYKLDKIFGSFNQFAEQTQWHQFASLKYEIESIRAKSSIQGYVITGITDVHWEVNGVLDMWRNEKVYTKEFSELQKPDVILCRVQKCNFYAGEMVEVEAMVSHFSDRALDGAEVRWSSGSETGHFKVSQSIATGNVATVGRFRVVAGQVDSPKIEPLEIELRDKEGHRIAENTYFLYVFPKAATVADVNLVLESPRNPGFAERLQQTGYYLTERTNNDALMIASHYNDEVAACLARGGRVLLLLDGEEQLPAEWGFSVKIRSGSELDGRWITNQNWIRGEQPPFSSVAFGRILGFESTKVVPHYVMQGIAPEKYDDVLAGVTYGWLNLNAALAVQMRIGEGKLFATTFRFDSYGIDPYATCLLDSIVRYARSAEFRPSLEVPVMAAT